MHNAADGDVGSINWRWLRCAAMIIEHFSGLDALRDDGTGFGVDGGHRRIASV